MGKAKLINELHSGNNGLCERGGGFCLESDSSPVVSGSGGG